MGQWASPLALERRDPNPCSQPHRQPSWDASSCPPGAAAGAAGGPGARSPMRQASRRLRQLHILRGAEPPQPLQACWGPTPGAAAPGCCGLRPTWGGPPPPEAPPAPPQLLPAARPAACQASASRPGCCGCGPPAAPPPRRGPAQHAVGAHGANTHGALHQGARRDTRSACPPPASCEAAAWCPTRRSGTTGGSPARRPKASQSPCSGRRYARRARGRGLLPRRGTRRR